jgi:hypothetical protein
VQSNDPLKFAPYALYDIPGNAWGINVLSNTLPYVYNAYPDYWDRIEANVKTAYENKLLSESQWLIWSKRFKNKDHYLGTKYNADSVYKIYTDRDALDTKAMNKQSVELKLPGSPFWGW